MSDSRTLTTWTRVLESIGSIAMLVGAVDPIEGSAMILPGSAMVALAAFLDRTERHLVGYTAGVFGLIAVGVAALWVESAVGGIGGSSGRSMWWALLILPYPVAWSFGIWRPHAPRWLLLLGTVVGLWYLVIPTMMLIRPQPRFHIGAGLFIGGIGLLTIVGCVWRLRRVR